MVAVDIVALLGQFIVIKFTARRFGTTDTDASPQLSVLESQSYRDEGFANPGVQPAELLEKSQV
jgi:hypothetical protein